MYACMWMSSKEWHSKLVLASTHIHIYTLHTYHILLDRWQITQTHIHIETQSSIQTYMHTCTYTYIHAHTFIQIWIHTLRSVIYTYTYMYIYTHTCLYTYTYICTHTNVCAFWQKHKRRGKERKAISLTLRLDFSNIPAHKPRSWYVVDQTPAHTNTKIKISTWCSNLSSTVHTGVSFY